MNYEAIIGLEIHVEMKTKSKMFSSAPVTFGDLPNTKTVVEDFGFPGTMPTVNKQAVINAIRVCNAMHMDIDNELWFDRKNYFYSDLPKGYQITQDKRPIGRNGFITIHTKDGDKTINIERLHLEEDTCKQLHSWDCTLLDYNRAGIPLIEIVSKPDIRSGEEAMKYAEKVRSIVSFLDVSDGRMEEGSLRCDVNISLRPLGQTKFGTKVEIKNLNSFVNIQKAIEFEIKRQEALLDMGIPVIQETRRFDEGSKETVLMRLKTDSVDYKYYTESNITPIHLSNDFIETAIESSNELAETRLARYKELGLSDYDCNLLISNKDISDYFDKLLKTNVTPKLAANWVIVDVQAILNKENISITDFIVSPEHLGSLIKLIEDKEVSNKQARDIFSKMLEKDQDPREVMKSLGTTLISNENELTHIICATIDKNPQSVIDYKNGKDRAVGFIVGMVMKATQGKADPRITNRLVVEEMKRR